jgi:hypothetical protein
MPFCWKLARRAWLPLVLVLCVFLALQNGIWALRATATQSTTPQDRLEVRTNRSKYLPGETVYIEGDAITPSITWTYVCPAGSKPDCGLVVRISIYDSNGNLLHNGTTDPNWAEYKEFFYTWQVPCHISLPAGASYRIAASMDGLVGKLTGETTISVIFPLGVPLQAMSVTTDKAGYSPGEVVYVQGFFQADWVARPLLVDLAINVTQRSHTLFDAKLTDLPVSFFSLPSCAWGISNETYMATAYFAMNFSLPQDNPAGISMVQAQAFSLRGINEPKSNQPVGLGGDARSFFVVDGWNHTATIQGIFTTQSDISYNTLKDSTYTSTHATQTVVIASTTVTTIAEFQDLTLPLLIATVLAVVFSGRRQSHKG